MAGAGRILFWLSSSGVGDGEASEGWHSVLAKAWRGLPLGMPANEYPSGLSITLTIFLREEPDYEDEDEEKHDGGGEDEDGTKAIPSERAKRASITSSETASEENQSGPASATPDRESSTS